MPSNLTPGTAIDVSSLLPYTVDLEIASAPTDPTYTPTCTATPRHAVWWKFTAGIGDTYYTVIGVPVTGGANYSPVVSIWKGTLPSITVINYTFTQLCHNTKLNKSINFPVVPGTTYYIQVVDSQASAPGSDLRFRIDRQPMLTAPLGSLCISDDDLTIPGLPTFPAAVIKVDGTFARFVTMPTGEFGTTLPNGKFCVQNGESAYGVAVMSSQFSIIASISFGGGIGGVQAIGCDQVDTFFVLTTNGSRSTIHKISDSGVILQTWLLPVGWGGAGFIVDRTQSIAYVPSTQAFATPIGRYDLVNSVPLTDLAPGIAGQTITQGGQVLADGSIVFIYETFPGNNPVTVRRYNTAGTLLNSFVVSAQAHWGVLNRWCFANEDSGGTVWIWNTDLNLDPVTSDFRRWICSTGVKVEEFTNISTSFAESGWTNNEGYPVYKWCISKSCPIIVLRQALTPTVPEVGAIVVTKTTSPAGSAEVFPFTTTGLTPSTFNLLDGQSQSFPDLVAGSGYGVSETVPVNWIASYTVSNGSPHDNITVAEGETVTVSVLNQDTTPVPPSPCSVGHGDCTPTISSPRIGM